MIGGGLDHPLTKICSRCKIEKSVEEFHKRSSRKNGYAPACKSCKKVIAKKYYDKNAEAVKERTRNWRRDNPEKFNDYKSRWNKANPQSARDRAKRWARENPERVRKNVHARRTRELEAQGFALESQIEARLDYHGRRCIYCKGPYEHLDHFFSLSRGGTNWPANLVPSCANCNRSKNARNPWDFIRSLA